MQKCACAGHSSMLNYLWSSVYALTVPLILPFPFVNASCKITKNPTLLPVGFKTRDFDTDWRDLHVFISKVDLPVLSLGAWKMEKILELLLKINLHV